MAVQLKGLARRVDESPQRGLHALGIAQDGRHDALPAAGPLMPVVDGGGGGTGAAGCAGCTGAAKLANLGGELGKAPIELAGVALERLDAEQVLVGLDAGGLEGAHKVAQALLPDAARAAGREVEEGSDGVQVGEALGEGGFGLGGGEVGRGGDEAVDAGADGGDVADDFV